MFGFIIFWRLLKIRWTVLVTLLDHVASLYCITILRQCLLKLSAKKDQRECQENNKKVWIPSVCEKVFMDKRNQSRHQKSIHQGMTYNCDQCDQSFTRAGSLQRKTWKKCPWRFEVWMYNLQQNIYSKVRLRLSQENCTWRSEVWMHNLQKIIYSKRKLRLSHPMLSHKQTEKTI